MSLQIDPPLINSANPWATTEADLRKLYECPSTGAVTTRTSLLLGWNHDPEVNQHIFYDAKRGSAGRQLRHGKGREQPVATASASAGADSSLNTLGYSPIPLDEYLEMIGRIVRTSQDTGAEWQQDTSTAEPEPKPWIVSVTGTATEVVECYVLVAEYADRVGIRLYLEINLSCPNIANKPPPAYSRESLELYLVLLQAVRGEAELPPIPVGIKVPPYTYVGQFNALIEALLQTTAEGQECPVQFITSTNTLGNCVVVHDTTDGSEPEEFSSTSTSTSTSPYSYAPALSSVDGTGIGGIGGAAIHPLSLGNVRTLRIALDKHEGLQQIKIIGVGGVSDFDGYRRMRGAGAAVVGVGTALGIHGVNVFETIMRGSEEIPPHRVEGQGRDMA